MPKVRAHWGVILLGVTVALSILRGYLEETPGHFRMFMDASRALWSGQRAYDIPFLGNLFFYSPASAMFIYGPFTLLPERAGLLLYLAVSGVVFVAGASRFACAQLPRRGQWALVALAPALFSSLVAHKLEVISTGILLWAMAGAWGNRAGAWIGSITQWKFQALPSLGLIAIERLLTKRSWRGAAAAVGAIVGWTALPFVFVDAGYLIEQQYLMKTSLSRYSLESFDRFDNLYAFLRFGLGVEMSYATSQILALAGGVLCAAIVVWAARARRGDTYMLALSLGGAYTVLFSPLQQISAYVLLAPVWLLAIGRPERALKRGEVAWLFFLWLGLSLGYSEFIPEELRQWLRSRSTRTVFAAALTAWVAFRLLVDPRPRSSYEAGSESARASDPRAFAPRASGG